jgi:hypothetical protein
MIGPDFQKKIIPTDSVSIYFFARPVMEAWFAVAFTLQGWNLK